MKDHCAIVHCAIDDAGNRYVRFFIYIRQRHRLDFSINKVGILKHACVLCREFHGQTELHICSKPFGPDQRTHL